MNINYIHKIVAGIALTVVFSSCVKNENSFGYEYMPDMYRSPAQEAYVDYGEVRSWKSNDSIKNTQSAKLPPMGTIPFQGANADPAYSMPYKRLPSKAMIVTHSAMSLEYSDEDYDASALDVNPMRMFESNVEHGKQLYTTFCDHCHGEKGAGDGIIAEKGLIVPPSNAFTKAEGQMFYSITYGKGDMGSHASQLNQKERWQVISYIKSMSGGVVIPDALKTLEMEKVTDIIGTGSTVELLPETLAGH
jgi:mono/diheme cytochrome c family protein